MGAPLSAVRLLLVLAVAAAAAGSSLPHSAAAGGGSRRIGGGVETTIERHNYLVGLERDDGDDGGPRVPRGGQLFCGGSILSATWILSAAHCFQGDASAANTRVRVGSTAAGQGGALLRVDRVEVSDGFDARRHTNDVALVHLATPISFNERARPIRLAARGPAGQAVPGAYVTVAGWGADNDYSNNEAVTKQLRVARIRMLNPELCKIAYSDAPVKFLETMVCGGVYGKRIDPSDAGGPVVTDDRTQVGIVSWGGGGFGQPEVFTDVSHPDIYDFVQQTIASETDEKYR